MLEIASFATNEKPFSFADSLAIIKNMEFIIAWLVSGAVILMLAYILPGITVTGFSASLLVAVVLGLVNAFIRPLLMFLTLPINILTFGLVTFAINALMVMLTAAIVPGFKVKNFWWAMLFSVILSMVMAFVY